MIWEERNRSEQDLQRSRDGMTPRGGYVARLEMTHAEGREQRVC